MSIYPTTLVTFTTKEDKIDIVFAEHVNKLQRETIAQQTIIGTNPQGSKATLNERILGSIGLDGTLRQGSVFPTGGALYGSGMPFYRNDESVLYIYNGATWDAQGQSLSNIAFCFAMGGSAYTTGLGGVVLATAYGGVASGNIKKLAWASASAEPQEVIGSKWKKLSGVTTIRLYTTLWIGDSAYTPTMSVAVGSVAGSIAGASGRTHPDWYTADLDVSGLDVGTYYDVIVKLLTSDTSSPAMSNHLVGIQF